MPAKIMSIDIGCSNVNFGLYKGFEAMRKEVEEARQKKECWRLR